MSVLITQCTAVIRVCQQRLWSSISVLVIHCITWKHTQVLQPYLFLSSTVQEDYSVTRKTIVYSTVVVHFEDFNRISTICQISIQKIPFDRLQQKSKMRMLVSNWHFPRTVLSQKYELFLQSCITEYCCIRNGAAGTYITFFFKKHWGRGLSSDVHWNNSESKQADIKILHGYWLWENSCSRIE